MQLGFSNETTDNDVKLNFIWFSQSTRKWFVDLGLAPQELGLPYMSL
jgi:hypothetical protein